MLTFDFYIDPKRIRHRIDFRTLISRFENATEQRRRKWAYGVHLWIKCLLNLPFIGGFRGSFSMSPKSTSKAKILT